LLGVFPNLQFEDVEKEKIEIRQRESHNLCRKRQKDKDLRSRQLSGKEDRKGRLLLSGFISSQ
jgi:hypothetical protein